MEIMIGTITHDDVTQSFMTSRRIKYKRLCFEVDVSVGDEERIDGRSRIDLPGPTPCLIFAFENY